MGKKRSDSTIVTTIPDDALVPLIAPGQDLQISKDDFIKEFGTTGAITSVGSSSGPQVLTGTPPNYKIRNLEPGSGVVPLLSPQNGIKFNHSFINGTGGVNLIKDITAKSPIIRNLSAGPGASVSIMNGDVQVSFTGTIAVTAIVPVTQKEDLPIPVGDVITLDGNTSYSVQIGVDISPCRLLINSTGVAVFGTNRLHTGFTTDNTGPLITVTGVGVVPIFREMLVTSPAGSIFDVQAGSGIVFNDVVNFNSLNDSTVNAAGNISFRNYTIFSLGDPVGGVVFTGACQEFNVSNGVYQDWTGTLFDFTGATFTNGISLGPNVRYRADSPNIVYDGLAATIPGGSVGLVTDSKFLGTAIKTNGFDETTGNWSFFHNQGILDSTVLGAMGQSGNATNTVLIDSTYVQLFGIMIASDFMERASINGSEQLEMENGQERRGFASATLDVTKIGGGTGTHLFSLFKNGAQIELTSGSPIEKNIEVTATDTQVTLTAPTSYVATDVFDVRISRQTGTNDLLIVNCVIEVR